MYLVEYSRIQDAFHVCDEDERLMIEMSCMERGFESDYEVVAEFENIEDALKFVRHARDKK